MTHPSEEQMIFYFYGEAEGRAEIERHLETCASCRTAYDALRQTLAAVDAAPVPERGEGYGREVWARIEPQLDAQRGGGWREWLQPRRLVLAGAMAVLLIVAFLAGRFSPHPGPEMAGPTSPEVRERILLVAVGDHLDRSQMVLIELVNTAPNGKVDIRAEQNRAEELVTANRLYRQTATTLGDTAMASVLDDLERVLLEIARSPSEISSQELVALQRRIESKGILFKVRVVGSQVREQEKTDIAKRAAGRS